MCHSVCMKERERERKCLLTLTHIFPHIYRPQRVVGDVQASYLINAGSFISGLHPKKLLKTKRNWINENYCRWIASLQADNIICKFAINLFSLIYVHLVFFFSFFGGEGFFLFLYPLDLELFNPS